MAIILARNVFEIVLAAISLARYMHVLKLIPLFPLQIEQAYRADNLLGDGFKGCTVTSFRLVIKLMILVTHDLGKVSSLFLVKDFCKLHLITELYDRTGTSLLPAWFLKCLIICLSYLLSLSI